MQSMKELKQLFEKRFHSQVSRIDPLTGQLGASGRTIVRLTNDKTSVIGVLYDVREENAAFLEFSRHFRNHGLPVPEIYIADLDKNVYLEEDLGEKTLYEFLMENRTAEQISDEVIEAYRKIVAFLPRFQVEAGRDLDYSVCYPCGNFDEQSISWDLNYFKYYFLKLAGVPFNEQKLENDFRKLTDFLLSTNTDYFMYRDFQSRNVMMRGTDPFFVDYQGGRRGALQYDIASLLYDSKADLPPSVRQALLDNYLDVLSKCIKIDRTAFMHHYYAYVYIRILQALGTYGYRGFFERKTFFLQSVPYALKNLKWLSQNVELPIKLPALTQAFNNMLDSERLKSFGAVGDNFPTMLTVQIFSFSFHQAAPTDETGHGGGFVFDARSLPNPGREETYKNLNGKDELVIDYLMDQESVQQYLVGVTLLLDASISNYQRRGFRNLMVSFGCTSGQHRSVFLAEQLAKHLHGRKGVGFTVTHLGLEGSGK